LGTKSTQAVEDTSCVVATEMAMMMVFVLGGRWSNTVVCRVTGYEEHTIKLRHEEKKFVVSSLDVRRAW